MGRKNGLVRHKLRAEIWASIAGVLLILGTVCCVGAILIHTLMQPSADTIQFLIEVLVSFLGIILTIIFGFIRYTVRQIDLFLRKEYYQNNLCDENGKWVFETPKGFWCRFKACLSDNHSVPTNS